MSLRPKHCAVLVTLLFANVAIRAGAATLRVPGEYPTIQTGIDAAAFGDTVLVAPGVYTDYEIRNLGTGVPWTACAFLGEGVVLKSEDGAQATVIDMLRYPGPQPAVIIANDIGSSHIVIEGFTITGAPLGGRGIYTFYSSTTIRGCVIRDIQLPQSNGAGMLALGDHSIIDTEFVNCYSEGTGGALYHSDGHLNLISCVIRECDSPAVSLNGGGGAPVESAYIADCTFTDNVSTSGAGAITCGQYFGGVTVTRCSFKGNINYSAGGGALAFGAGNRLIENCVFVANGALAPNGQGGAISVGGIGSCVVRGNTFFGNYKTPNSSAGGAVAFYADATFENNIVVESTGGGAVFDSINSDLISNCNVFWMNPEGNGIPLSPTDREVNPLFCGSAVEDFTVDAASPCLPENSLGCGLIGANGQGCSATSVAVPLKASSWGAIKSAYRVAIEP